VAVEKYRSVKFRERKKKQVRPERDVSDDSDVTSGEPAARLPGTGGKLERK
jgi:hypothetical protein